MCFRCRISFVLCGVWCGVVWCCTYKNVAVKRHAGAFERRGGCEVLHAYIHTLREAYQWDWVVNSLCETGFVLALGWVGVHTTT